MSKSSNEPTVTEGYVHVDSFLDDNYTSVTLSGPDWKATGNARREPGDVVDDEIGYTLALGRALENAGRKMTKRANGLVKHADDVKAAKEAKVAKAAAYPSIVERFVADGYPYVVSHGFEPGPDFSDPSDPVFNQLHGIPVIGDLVGDLLEAGFPVVIRAVKD